MIPYNVPINAQRMTIGVQGENNVRQFLFDVTEWRQLTGDIGTAEMVVQRWGDTSPYAATITMADENTVSWVPTSADTAKDGVGKIQLMWLANGQTVKTKIFDMKVNPALEYQLPDDSLDPWASWMPDVINAAAAMGDLPGTVADAAADWLEENIGPTTPAVDASLSVSGAAADAKVAGDKVTELKNALEDFNKYNLLSKYAGVERTYNGVTYAYDSAKGIVNVDGEATGTSFSNIFFPTDDSGFPEGVEAGGVYNLVIRGATNAGIRVIFYQNTTSLGGKTYFNNSIIVVPEAATRMVVRAQVETGVRATNETIHYALLNSKGRHIKLLPENYTLSAVELPANTTVEGCGNATTITLDDSATYAVKLTRGCTIKDVKIIGAGGNAWIPDGEISESHGIYITQPGGSESNRNRIQISGVEISGFSGGGICLDNTGLNYDDGVNIVNAYIHNNNVGLYNVKRSEYCKITNVAISRNWIGCVNNGGNNLFVNCGFNGNRTGLVMDSTGIASSNNSHGSFVGCNFCHTHAFDSQETLTAISLVGQTNGEMFVGCTIAYGYIQVVDSSGVVFGNCNFLADTGVAVDGGGLTLISGSTFKVYPQEKITADNGASIVIADCYTYDGRPVKDLTLGDQTLLYAEDIQWYFGVGITEEGDIGSSPGGALSDYILVPDHAYVMNTSGRTGVDDKPTNFVVVEYDAGKNFLSRNLLNPNAPVWAITDNCKYIRLYYFYALSLEVNMTWDILNNYFSCYVSQREATEDFVKTSMDAEKVIDVLKEYGTFETQTIQGITYNWENYKCTVSGTATELSRYNVVARLYPLPCGIKPGDRLLAIMDKTPGGSNPYLTIAWYDEDGNEITVSRKGEAAPLMVPEGAVGITVQIRVASGVSITSTEISRFSLIKIPSQVMPTPLIVTFVDDDATTTITEKYHDACRHNGIYGTFAALAKNIGAGNASAAQIANGERLLQYADEGFAVIPHAWTQSSEVAPIWTAASVGDDESAVAFCRKSIADTVRYMRTKGFLNTKHWLTPYGVHGAGIRRIAKELDFDNLISYNDGRSNQMQEYDRYWIKRVSFATPNGDHDPDGTAVQRIKSDIDAALATGCCWLIITTHFNEWGDISWDDTLDGDGYPIGYSQFNEVVQYALSAGFVSMTLPAAWTEYAPILDNNRMLMNKFFAE